MEVRVRMAPSPTGFLHIGTARTALFNWLFAKKHGGRLVLRIEDTDTERSKPEFERDIIEQLSWLGMAWDEGPFRQSERTELYTKHLQTLLGSGRAYWCACTKEDLEAQRQTMLAAGIAPRYMGTCRGKGLTGGVGHVIRFVMPEKKISFTDLVRGHIEFDATLSGDIVIAKSLSEPLYNFAVVVDDAEMRITHVIRGEDGIPNTPKQIALQEALGFAHPHYGHVPLILDPDGSKMSKRNSATALKEYREAGYLPHALVNFLALLGWHPQDDREFMTREEIAHMFDLARVQKAGAVFSLQKLNWMNAHYLRAMTGVELATLAGYEPSSTNTKVMELAKTRAETVSELKDAADAILILPEYEADLLRWKTQTTDEVRASLTATEALIAGNKDSEIMPLAQERGKGEILWPLRVALSGKKESAGPLELLNALGKDEALRRLTIAKEKLD